MIPKFICWLFGHIWKEKFYTSEGWEGYQYVKYWKWTELDRCPRCGKDFREEK